MNKGFIFGVLLLTLVAGSIGMAATSHTVSVSVPGYFAISVGTDVALNATFDGDGLATPSGASKVSVKTNQTSAYNVTATATPTSTPSLSASKLSVNGASLANPAVAFTHTGKTNGSWVDHAVTYQANLDGSEDVGNYSWSVAYTAAVQP